MPDASDVDSQVEGTAAPGYEAVVRAFAVGINDIEANGAALSVWRDGVEVVDVWAGVADHRESAPWSSDTLNVIFSSSKGLAAIVMARLEDTGRLDLRAPISDVWPEFSAHGKGAISVADVLAHRAGVSAPRDDLTLEDVLDSAQWAERIAAQEPLWEPGSGHAYHALTFGPIVQELVRRAAGRELHEIFAEEIAAPLQADATLKPGPEEAARVAHLTTSSAWNTAITNASPHDDEWIGRALTLGSAFPRPLVQGEQGFNDSRVLQAGLAVLRQDVGYMVKG
ncbi:serine hydrolase domain-containing protein [Arthrobacter sedimenti]|uniref:serine hydrolase domain-containing protein n=1 Tax=Arthrobacter sedimenti TaxID=2694931 RepID=UPI00141EB2B9|nr:serine hydrolase domain-containing protein [Arthrobacter sedimenti]